VEFVLQFVASNDGVAIGSCKFDNVIEVVQGSTPGGLDRTVGPDSTTNKCRYRTGPSNSRDTKNPCLDLGRVELLWFKLGAQEPFKTAVPICPPQPFRRCIRVLLVGRPSSLGKVLLQSAG
jgi:hypothetical protein